MMKSQGGINKIKYAICNFIKVSAFGRKPTKIIVKILLNLLKFYWFSKKFAGNSNNLVKNCWSFIDFLKKFKGKFQ